MTSYQNRINNQLVAGRALNEIAKIIYAYIGGEYITQHNGDSAAHLAFDDIVHTINEHEAGITRTTERHPTVKVRRKSDNTGRSADGYLWKARCEKCEWELSLRVLWSNAQRISYQVNRLAHRHTEICPNTKETE